MTITERKKLNNPHQPVGRWITPTRRLAIYMRDGFRCVLCEKDLSSVAARDRTLDHHVPRHQGGTNDNENLYTCCRSCNHVYSHEKRSPAQLRRVMAALNRQMTQFIDAASVLVRARAEWYREAA